MADPEDEFEEALKRLEEFDKALDSLDALDSPGAQPASSPRPDSRSCPNPPFLARGTLRDSCAAC